MRETIFVWDSVSDCVMSELDGSGAVQATYTNEPQQYGGIISQRRGTTTSTYHSDALGSTRALTDNFGNVTDTYLNDAWGNSVASTGTTVNPFRWVGKYGYYTDNGTAQVYVRARMYQRSWRGGSALIHRSSQTGATHSSMAKISQFDDGTPPDCLVPRVDSKVTCNHPT
jgi:hypothetical protein